MRHCSKLRSWKQIRGGSPTKTAFGYRTYHRRLCLFYTCQPCQRYTNHKIAGVRIA